MLSWRHRFLTGSEAAMKYRLGAALILALYGIACAPTNANKRRYRMDQNQLDPDSRNPGTPASTPGSVTPGTAPGTGPGGSTGGTVKPVPGYTLGNKGNRRVLCG
jgi:hypothetical protein